MSTNKKSTTSITAAKKKAPAKKAAAKKKAPAKKAAAKKKAPAKKATPKKKPGVKPANSTSSTSPAETFTVITQFVDTDKVLDGLEDALGTLADQVIPEQVEKAENWLRRLLNKLRPKKK